MPFLLAEILNFQGSTHRYGMGSLRFLILQTSTIFVIYKSAPPLIIFCLVLLLSELINTKI